MLCRPTVIVILLFCLLCARPAAAELDQANAEIIALEIRNLSTSVDRLTRLLYDQAVQEQNDKVLRKLDIAVAYLNFRSRRIETLQRDLQNTRSTRTRMEDISRQMEVRLEELEQQAADQPGPSDALEINRDEIRQQLAMLKKRSARLDTEILDYENNLAELQSQLDSVESFVERHLEL